MTELYSRLENWRRKQVSQVNATLTGKQRRRALVALLDKETELLRSLEAHRAIRSARRRNAAIARFLQEVSASFFLLHHFEIVFYKIWYMVS